MLADSHAHLHSFADLKGVVGRAKAAGVSRIITNSTSPQDIPQDIAISKEFPSVLCAIGIHPSELLSLSEAEISKGIKMVEKNVKFASAIGEIGLDFKHAKTDAERAIQERFFREFIRLAIKNKKPVCVHARYAETRCLDILEEEGAKKVHMHWFTNSKKTASRAISLGYYISCGPIILSDEQSAEVVKSIPLENLLLETDSPVPFMGRDSEPSWIPRVCAKVAQLKGIKELEIEKRTGANFTALFGEK